MSPFEPLLAVGGVALLNHAVMRAGGRRVARRDRPAGGFRRLLLAGSVLAGLATVAALALVDAPVRGAARGLVGPLGERAVTAVAQSLVGLAVVAVVLVGYLGAFVHLRRARGLSTGAGRAGLRMARFLLVGLGFVVVGLQAGSFLLSAAGPAAGLVAVSVVLAAVAYLASPYLVAAGQSTRRPRGSEATRLGDLRERAGLDVHATRVLDTGDQPLAFAQVRGPPGRRYLFVTDHLLTGVTDDTAAAVVAVAAGRARYDRLAFRLSAVVVGAVTLAVLLAADAVVLAPAALAVLWAGAYLGGRWVVYRADDYAAGRVGAAALAGALEAVADLHDQSLDAGWADRLVALAPPPGARVDRLRAAA